MDVILSWTHATIRLLPHASGMQYLDENRASLSRLHVVPSPGVIIPKQASRTRSADLNYDSSISEYYAV